MLGPDFMEARPSLQTKEEIDEGIANAFDTFWLQELAVPKNHRLIINLKIGDSTGTNGVFAVTQPEQILKPQPTMPEWQDTVIDSGNQEAFVVINKSNPDDETSVEVTIGVNLFTYIKTDGTSSYRLMPKSREEKYFIQGKQTTQGRGAAFRGS